MKSENANREKKAGKDRNQNQEKLNGWFQHQGDTDGSRLGEKGKRWGLTDLTHFESDALNHAGLASSNVGVASRRSENVVARRPNHAPASAPPSDHHFQNEVTLLGLMRRRW